MKTIPLTQGKVALVDDDVSEALSDFNWCAKRDGKTYYAMRRVSRPGRSQTTVCMHREIFRLKGKPVPKKVDHRDRNGLNNLWKNLRPATSLQNSMNSRKRCNNTSGFIGVSWDKGKWRVQVRVNGKVNTVGRFDDPAEAARARDRFVKKHHGEFAVLNNA